MNEDVKIFVYVPEHVKNIVFYSSNVKKESEKKREV